MAGLKATLDGPRKVSFRGSQPSEIGGRPIAEGAMAKQFGSVYQFRVEFSTFQHECGRLRDFRYALGRAIFILKHNNSNELLLTQFTQISLIFGYI
jgi:hypothetical protein